jgi:hypothetical protein
MKFLTALMGKTKQNNQKHTHQRWARNGGYTEANQGK